MLTSPISSMHPRKLHSRLSSTISWIHLDPDVDRDKCMKKAFGKVESVLICSRDATVADLRDRQRTLRDEYRGSSKTSISTGLLLSAGAVAGLVIGGLTPFASGVLGFGLLKVAHSFYQLAQSNKMQQKLESLDEIEQQLDPIETSLAARERMRKEAWWERVQMVSGGRIGSF